ncbi:MAG TPA: putative Ig domain-containing protein [Solirubrobacteraceae bacterium]|jgi:hypothetical protein
MPVVFPEGGSLFFGSGQSSFYSNSQGESYYVEGVPDGAYPMTWVYIGGEGDTGLSGDLYFKSEGPVVEVDGGDVTHDFAFDLPLGSLKVLVKGAGGEGVGGAYVAENLGEGVTVDDTAGNAYELISNDAVQAGAGGEAEFTVVDGHTYSVCASSINYAQECTTVKVEGNTTAEVDLALSALAAPTGLAIPSPTAQPSLTWEATSEAASYDVYRDGVKIGSATTTSYTDETASVGSHSYYVTAVDAGGESGPSNTVTATVGTAPAITSAESASTGMRAPFSFTVTTTGSPTPNITESGSLPSGLSFTDNGDGTATISGEASAGTSGSYPITLTADNGISSAATQSLDLTVTAASAAPTITSANGDAAINGEAFSFTVTTDGYPAPTLKKTGSLPGGVTFTDNGNGTATIAGTPAGNADGVYDLTITGKSSAGTATQSFALTVDRPPTISNTAANVTSSVGAACSLSIDARGYPTPSLTESGALPEGLGFVDDGDGTAALSGMPAIGSGGAYPITVTATSSQGTDTYSFTLKVDEGPAFTSEDAAAAAVGSPFSFQVTATGYPIPHIARTGALPKRLTYAASTGVISGTPASGADDTYTITFKATNSTGAVTQAFTLTVEG